MKTMKAEAKPFLIFRIIAVVFYSLILLTMFMPMLSLDEYVEYEFYKTEYFDEYKSSSTPLASKITPLDFMKTVGNEEVDAAIKRRQYSKVKNELVKRYNDNEITEEEYYQLLSETPEANAYYVSLIYVGSADYARIQDKIVLISMVTIIIYAFATIMLLFNLFNLVFNAKFLYITNAQASWIYAAATLLFVIYIFATSLTNQNTLSDGAVLETTMVCLSANSTFIIMLISEIAYSVISLIVSSKFNKSYTYIEEVPEFISYRIKKESKKPYIAPSSAPSKPKSYYTKKRKKKKKKKNGKKR